MLLKKNISFLLLLSVAVCSQAQYSHQEKLSITEGQQFILDKFNEKQTRKTLKSTSDYSLKRIPVVFHIIHNSGPENIPDSLIHQQIEILNNCYRKEAGTIGDGAGVDTKIEFCLAKFDPDGNPSTGITRTQSTCADETSGICGHPSEVIFWGNEQRQYLNIWVLKKVDGSPGYGGVFGHAVVQYDYVGKNSLFNGRLVVHEVGHWLGLYHTFHGGCGDDCTSSGDYICDTPPQESESSNCNTQNTCHNDQPDVNDQVQNYMDYSLSCANMFTQGQMERMHAVLETFHNEIIAVSNLDSVGCADCLMPPCAPVADFVTEKQFYSVGDTVWFKDNSLNNPTSWYWNFAGGSPMFSSNKNPYVIYNAEGTYSTGLIVSNAAGGDTLVKTNNITIKNENWEEILDNSFINAMKEYKGELYAGGSVIQDEYSLISRWDGNKWSKVGNGLIYRNGYINSFTVFKEKLYVGGGVIGLDSSTTVRIAAWNGEEWMTVTHISGNNPQVQAMTTYNDELYIGGGYNFSKWFKSW